MSNYICDLTNKINQLTNIIKNMQRNSGLYTDPSTEQTLTGRIKRLEETTITTDPTESNISRVIVDRGLLIDGNKVTLTKNPSSDIINDEIMARSNIDPDISEPVGVTHISDNIAYLETEEYDGWSATASYSYAEKITFEELKFTDSVEELVKDMYSYTGNIYAIIVTITPTDQPNDVILKWVNNIDTNDYAEETISTEHIRYITETEFNNSLYITGSADISIEVRNRLG